MQKKKKMLGLKKISVIIKLTKNELINFDIELGGISYVFCLKKSENANYPLYFLNMMECLKFNRLEIYKFMAFNYSSFKTSHIFLDSM